jgi:hypothetical protein
VREGNRLAHALHRRWRGPIAQEQYMACELFDGGRLARCGAVSGLLIPSHHERERYCRSDESHVCPTYRLYRLRGALVPQADYYALWLAPGPLPDEPPELEPFSERV